MAKTRTAPWDYRQRKPTLRQLDEQLALIARWKAEAEKDALVTKVTSLNHQQPLDAAAGRKEGEMRTQSDYTTNYEEHDPQIDDLGERG